MNHESYGEGVDIWGAGCIGFEMMTLDFLWERKGLLAATVKMNPVGEKSGKVRYEKSRDWRLNFIHERLAAKFHSTKFHSTTVQLTADQLPKQFSSALRECVAGGHVCWCWGGGEVGGGRRGGR